MAFLLFVPRGFASHTILLLKGMKMELECNECEKKFTRKITLSTIDVRCPRCGGYDTEPADGRFGLRGRAKKERSEIIKH